MTEGATVLPADRAPQVTSRADGHATAPPPDGRTGVTNRAQMVRFACVGVASTVAFVLLYLALRGLGVPAQAANLVCQFVTAVANTTANRRLTFGIRGSANAGRHQIQGLIAFGAGLAVTAAALAGLHAVSARPARIVEVIVLVAATLVATVVRFILYRFWVFRPRQDRQQ